MKINLIYNYDFLSESFKVLDKCSWWVQNAYQSYSNSKSLLNNLDCIAARFEKTNKNILLKKVNNFCNKEKNWRNKGASKINNNEREKERQIFSFFSELKVAEELNNNGFEEIKFIKEEKNKVPDLYAKKDDLIYYVEVKRLQNPREEDESLRSAGQYSGYVNTNFYEPLKKKICDFIVNANEKFKNLESNIKTEQKVLVIDFSPGIDARLNDNFSNSSLNSIFGSDYFINLEKNYNIKICTRKYF